MEAKTKILIVEHDENDIELVQHELKKGKVNYIAEIVQTENAYENALRNFKPDIILSDYALPAFSGTAAFAIRNKIAPHTPFIFVSGTIGEENSNELIRNGVTDYVLKEKLFTLPVKVNRALKEAEERQQNIKVEEALKESEAMLRHLLEAVMLSEKKLEDAQQIAHLGNWELDFATGLGIWSDEACRIYGLPLEENKVTYDNWLSFIHPDDLEYLKNINNETKKTLSDTVFDHRIVLRNGTVKYIHSVSKCIFDLNGNPTRLFGISHDVTEIVYAKKKEEESERKFKDVAEQLMEVSSSIPGAVYQFVMKPDGSFSFLFISKGMYELTGVSINDIYEDASLPFALIHADDFPQVMQSIWVSGVHLTPWLQIFRMQPLNSDLKWIRGNSIPGKLPDGSILWNGTFIDFTQTKEAENKLTYHYAELKKTNSELDRFVYSTSHDLRAPLKSMLGLIGIIKESTDHGNSIQHERLEMLNKSVLNLDDFIEDILHYSHNARMEVAKEEITFEEVIQEISGGHMFIDEAKGLKLQIEIHQDIKFISDKRRINVILNNVISNAIKYRDASKGNPFVYILVHCSKENAIITIEDNGIGIADKEKEKIFEMFYRATALSSGSGLGMYIVKETIEKLGATIHIESELGVGTKITVTIPQQLPSLK